MPNIAVEAISSTGNKVKINILEECLKKKKKVLLFWYPKDFTFVCPTELHAFQEALPEFEKRNTIVLGASCDSSEVHFAWLNTPKSQGGVEGVTYSILSDTHRQLASLLGILDQEISFDEDIEEEVFSGANVTYRATYLIDEEGRIFHESVNDMPIGRDVKEYLRLIDAQIHFKKYGDVCPANWQQGDEAMKPNREATAKYLSSH